MRGESHLQSAPALLVRPAAGVGGKSQSWFSSDLIIRAGADEYLIKAGEDLVRRVDREAPELLHGIRTI